MTETKAPSTNFIRNIIQDDLQQQRVQSVVTRFPPEPSGYLHVGHAKAIYVSFSMAEEFKGKCFLRFDDTNPENEDSEFVEAIKEDIQWLGFSWCAITHASDYFDQLFDYAVALIQQGKAYVCSLTPEQMREYRGTLTTPGKNSPYRDRSVDENIDLFMRMKAGEFQDGEQVLRAKMDMSSGNMNMRDPVIYRIKHVSHQQTGDKWCVYPMYDFTHSLSDAIECITHSLCSLEFQDHRPLYDWCVENCDTPGEPHQYEFARLNLNYTVTSKRRLKTLVEAGKVDGWDDPRMPTLKGLRRRGFPPQAICKFCEQTGISKSDSTIDMSVLENCVRDELNVTAARAMAVLDPIKVVIENYPEDKEEWLDAPNHPQDAERGTRKMPFARELLIDRDDFMEDPPTKFFRLGPGREVRLRYAYVIKCEEVIKDASGKVTELRCSADFDTLGKKPEGRKVKGIIHWLSEKHAVAAEVRAYDRLFTVESPAREDDLFAHLNTDSLQVFTNAWIEPSLQEAAPETVFQFERLGYFVADRVNHSAGTPVFNKTVGLRDSWTKAKSL